MSVNEYPGTGIIFTSLESVYEDFFTPHSDQRYALGRILELSDGRRFRYSEAGGSDLVKAHVNQGAAGTANWQNESQANGTAASVGDTSITIAVSTAPSANDWDNGYLTIEDGTGEAEMYTIRSHDSGTTTPTVYLKDPGGIRTATTASSSTEVTVTMNPYKEVVVAATNPTNILTGVNLTAVTKNYFFWSQVRGPCPVVVDDTDTIVVGDMVMASESVAGTCALVDAAADDHPFGWVMRAASTEETALIMLTIE